MKTLRRLSLLLLSLPAASLMADAEAYSTAQDTMKIPAAIFFRTGIQEQLEVAIRSDDAPAIARAIAGGASANARGKAQVTPLMIATDAQKPAAVAALLHSGADANLRAGDGNSAVTLAVENYAAKPHGRVVLAKINNSRGDPNALRPDGDPVIVRFIYDAALDDVRWFKSLGADLDILGRDHQPLITSVAMAQNWDAVWCLIELGARYDYEHGQSTQPLSEALAARVPAPGSPLYDYKLKVWQLMKDKGLPVQALKP